MEEKKKKQFKGQAARAGEPRAVCTAEEVMMMVVLVMIADDDDGVEVRWKMTLLLQLY